MRLFGTDGIRGLAYEPPLDRETVTRIGLALASHLSSTATAHDEAHRAPRVLIGRDTRKSGPELEQWLTFGLAAGGAEVASAAIITTPAVAHLTRSLGFDAGVVISASHNPFRDNGIKVLLGSGDKSDEALEGAIERDVALRRPLPEGSFHRHGGDTTDTRFESLYLDHLVATLGDATLPPLTLALDCAQGAGYQVGPKLLERLGLSFHLLAAEPNGENINRDCGSTHMEALRATVVDSGLALGAALDGDGDRLLLCDSRGRIIDGDAILLLSARRLRKEKRLAGDGVVATVMSNMALELALSREGVRLFRTQVGDKFVRREMAERNIVLGGEQSGHILFTELASTGDGLLTLVQVLRTLALEGRSLDEIADLTPFPQILTNVPVRERPVIHEVPEIAAALARAEGSLDGRGRILVRYSGTEPLLRIMVEGPEHAEIEALSSEVSRAIERSIGGKA